MANTKRSALRFTCEKLSSFIKTEYEDGEASIINISTNGCALGSVTIPLTVDERVLLSFNIGAAEDQVEIRAAVIRAENGVVALSFINPAPETQALIRNCCVRELQTNQARKN